MNFEADAAVIKVPQATSRGELKISEKTRVRL
jgi:hypothetical protein